MIGHLDVPKDVYTFSMEPWHIALLIKPFVFLLVFAATWFCIRRPVEKWMPEGKLKRFLLFRID